MSQVGPGAGVAAVAQVRTAYGSSIPRIASLPELEQDADGLRALERIAQSLGQPPDTRGVKSSNLPH